MVSFVNKFLMKIRTNFYKLNDPLIMMINHYKICLYNIMSLGYLLNFIGGF